jgi:hypothetical protein
MASDERAERRLENRDKVDFLLKLADVAWRDYSDRRTIEWKVNLALWAGLGAFGGFMFQLQTRPPILVGLTLTILLVFVFLIYVFFWKAEIQERNTRDLNNANYYWTAADHELGTKPPENRRPLESSRWRPTHLSQIFVTLLFILLTVLAAWAPRKSTAVQSRLTVSSLT